MTQRRKLLVEAFKEEQPIGYLDPITPHSFILFENLQPLIFARRFKNWIGKSEQKLFLRMDKKKFLLILFSQSAEGIIAYIDIAL